MVVMLFRVVSPIEIPIGLGFSEASWKFSSLKHDNLHKNKSRLSMYLLYTDRKHACVGFEPEHNGNFLIRSSIVANPTGKVTISPEQKVYDVVLKHAALVNDQRKNTSKSIDVKSDIVLPGTMYLLKDAYDRCGQVCAEYAKTFYLGTLLMTPERRRAIWSIYVWCRRTDELVDGPNASHITPSALDRWEARLEDLFAGRPYDMFDVALSDTVSRFHVDIQACIFGHIT